MAGGGFRSTCSSTQPATFAARARDRLRSATTRRCAPSCADTDSNAGLGMRQHRAMRGRLLVATLLLTACGSKSEPPPPTSTAGGSEARFGPLMLQIGHRLELSGRAARAGRWELARYEVQELREVYEGPLLDP